MPGNHDSRNVGYVHFEELFGARSSVLRKSGVTVVAVDSTEPDLDHGQIGRGRYGWIEEQFAAEPATLQGLRAPPSSAADPRNRAASATSSTTRATRSSACSARACNLVLSGHKHVPYAWKLENLFVVNTGTVSTLRLRGNTRPCYNVIEVVGHARRHLAALPVSRAGADHPVRRRDRRVREVHRPDRARGDGAEMRAVALIDGEHYPPVVRDALAALPYEWVGAILVGGTEKLRGPAAQPTTACRSSTALTARRSSSTCPTSRCSARPSGSAGSRARSPPGCRTSAPISGSTRRVFEPFALPSIAVIGTGQARREDRGQRACRPAARARPHGRGRRDGARRAGRAGGGRAAADGRGPRRAVARRAAMRRPTTSSWPRSPA